MHDKSEAVIFCHESSIADRVVNPPLNPNHTEVVSTKHGNNLRRSKVLIPRVRSDLDYLEDVLPHCLDFTENRTKIGVRCPVRTA